MKLISDIKNDERACIICKTSEESLIIQSLMDKAGLTWASGSYYRKRFIFDDSFIIYSPAIFFPNRGYYSYDIGGFITSSNSNKYNKYYATDFISPLFIVNSFIDNIVYLKTNLLKHL